jgi:hypothetical protein
VARAADRAFVFPMLSSHLEAHRGRFGSPLSKMVANASFLPTSKPGHPRASGKAGSAHSVTGLSFRRESAAKDSSGVHALLTPRPLLCLAGPWRRFAPGFAFGSRCRGWLRSAPWTWWASRPVQSTPPRRSCARDTRNAQHACLISRLCARSPHKSWAMRCPSAGRLLARLRRHGLAGPRYLGGVR